MSNPPKRIRVVFDERTSVRVVDTGSDSMVRSGPSYGCATEHFYNLEEKEKSMEQKEMTAQDAWIAMAKGECVSTSNGVHRIYSCQYLQIFGASWHDTDFLSAGPYSIVPDPSKPEVDEYEQDRCKVVESPMYPTLADERSALICFIEKHFQRKGES